jgi:hypothetical protein
VLPPPNPFLFAFFTTVCTLLVLKAQILGASTAAMRGKLKKFLNPDNERVQRIFRTHRNDLENVLPFFISRSLFLASGGTIGLAGPVFDPPCWRASANKTLTQCCLQLRNMYTAYHERTGYAKYQGHWVKHVLQ